MLLLTPGCTCCCLQARFCPRTALRANPCRVQKGLYQPRTSHKLPATPRSRGLTVRRVTKPVKQGPMRAPLPSVSVQQHQLPTAPQLEPVSPMSASCQEAPNTTTTTSTTNHNDKNQLHKTAALLALAKQAAAKVGARMDAACKAVAAAVRSTMPSQPLSSCFGARSRAVVFDESHDVTMVEVQLVGPSNQVAPKRGSVRTSKWLHKLRSLNLSFKDASAAADAQ